MLVTAKIGNAGRPPAPKSRLPGWCAVHVVPVVLASGRRADLALLFEPFSGAMFGNIRAVFEKIRPFEVSGREDEPELAAFVRESLNRLPAFLSTRVTTIYLTAPDPGEGLATWYNKDAVNEDTVNPIPLGEPFSHMICRRDKPTRRYAAVDLGALFSLSQIPQADAYLARALDAHNLAQNGERLGPIIFDMGVNRWSRDGEPTFKPKFFRGKPVRLPPEVRLELTLPTADKASLPTSPITASETVAEQEPAQNASIRQRLRYGYTAPRPDEDQVDHPNRSGGDQGLV
jgi:hypothetical protein